MKGNYVSAVFDNRTAAESAVMELRSVGIEDRDISVIEQHRGKDVVHDGAGEDATRDFVGKTALGAGLGTIAGIAILAIPGVGPLAAAGAIAASAVEGAAVTGLAVGAAAGGLQSALGERGVGEDDARYYQDRMGAGGVVISADTGRATVGHEAVQDILYRNGGHSSSRARTAVM